MIIYINNSRIPTEKAHGVNIINMCQSFSRLSKVVLIVPNIANNIKKSVSQYYFLDINFKIKKLFTISFLKYENLLGKSSFYLQTINFYISVFLYLLFKSRKDNVIYTREFYFSLLSFLGFRVVFECHSIPKRQKVFFNLCKRFNKIIVISRGLQKYFFEQGFDKDNIFLAPDAVDIERFDINITLEDARKSLSLPIDKKIICYCGKFKTMGMDKGISNILYALKKLNEHIHFVAVGGSEKDIKEYRSQAEKLKVDTRVSFIGHVTQEMIARYQKAADILLMPFPLTKHYAEFMSPIKMFEYMASKRPIIASDLPTIREVLNNDNAFICKPDEPKDLANKIGNVLNNQELASSISQEAYNDMKNYSWEKRASVIFNCINN